MATGIFDRLGLGLRLGSLFKPRAAKAVGERLYATCVAQSRQPVLYTDYGVADEIGARFELLTLHVVMMVTVLRQDGGEQAAETAQALFDALLLALDTTLREQGTGDLSVPKKMKAIGQVVYTRLKVWDDLWREGAQAESQAAYLAGTVYAGDKGEARADAPVHALQTYVAKARGELEAADLVKGLAGWTTPRPLAGNEHQEEANHVA